AKGNYVPFIGSGDFQNQVPPGAPATFVPHWGITPLDWLGSVGPVRMTQVKDGLSNTLMLGEVRQHPTQADTRSLLWWGSYGLTSYLTPNTTSPDFTGAPGQCDNQPG